MVSDFRIWDFWGFQLGIFWGFFGSENPKSPYAGFGIFNLGFSGIPNPRFPSPGIWNPQGFFDLPKMKIPIPNSRDGGRGLGIPGKSQSPFQSHLCFLKNFWLKINAISIKSPRPKQTRINDLLNDYIRFNWQTSKFIKIIFSSKIQYQWVLYHCFLNIHIVHYVIVWKF